MKQSNKTNQLKGRFTSSIIALLIATLAVVAATYAWYIYNTSRHTTNVRMAAGTGVNLQISNTYDGNYGSAAVLDSFSGRLVPVSTNRISGGFQKALEFVKGSESQPELVAGVFGEEDGSEYYRTSLFLRTNGSATDVYLSDIGFEDSDAAAPISSAIRVGLVAHQPGRNNAIQGEYIFEISDAKNPEAQYNTATGTNGDVLDCTKTDGTTVPFTPYTTAAFCNYDQNTGAVSLNSGSQKLCTVAGTSDNKPGTPVEVEVYIWLEGCDEDCTANLCNQTLKNLAVSFAGVTE